MLPYEPVIAQVRVLPYEPVIAPKLEYKVLHRPLRKTQEKKMGWESYILVLMNH